MKRDYPDRPLIGVGAVIVSQGRVVVVRRGHEPLKGEWSIPGGVLEIGETLRAGAAREALEETGLVVEAGEVRREHHDVRPGGIEVLEAFEPDEAADSLVAPPPQHAAVDESPAERAERRARQLLPLARVHPGKALLKVDARHPPALRDQPEEQAADRVADARERAERQPVDEPHQEEKDPAHVGKGFAPFGVL